MSLAFINFAHPALLWGAALIGVPILIHLLNQRRFKRIDWAAMDLLRTARRKSHRRLLLEDLLTLILRCLAVLLLVLLIARMIISGSPGLARLTGTRTEHVFILDDSPSMQLQQGNRALFLRATAALGEYARRLAHGRPGDTLTVILTSAPDQPFLNGQILSGDHAEAVAGAIEALSAATVPARFDQAFLGPLRMAEDEPGVNRILHVISDFRRHDWLSGNPETGVPAQLAALAGAVANITLIDIGRKSAANLAITDIRPDEGIIATGVRCPMLVTIANHGTVDSEPAVIAVTANNTPAARATVPAMAPGSSETISVPVTFARSGSATIETELRADDQLPVDNRRAYAATVESAIRILAVDGEPHRDRALSETFYLQRALVPPGETVSGMRVEVVDEDTFDIHDLDRVRLLFLCNVYRLTEKHWRAIADWTHNGGGLVIFPGDQVDGAFWNKTVNNAAPGLLPVQFVEMTGDTSEREWQTLRIRKPDHPVLQAFTGDRNPFLQRVKVFRYWKMKAEHQTATVLATFANEQPALVEAIHGAGRVLVFAAAADAEYNNWPSDASYLVTLQQIARNLAPSVAAARVLTVGSRLRHEITPALYRSKARLFAPGKQETEILQATASTNSTLLTFESAALRSPGLWRLELATHEGEAPRVDFAANIAAEESDLTGLDPDELLRRAGDKRIRFVEGTKIPAPDNIIGGRSDLTRLLAVLLIGTLMLEQGAAWRVGRRHRV